MIFTNLAVTIKQFIVGISWEITWPKIYKATSVLVLILALTNQEKYKIALKI
jgi:hypothetical protein